jgi:hypothetical protein
LANHLEHLLQLLWVGRNPGGLRQLLGVKALRVLQVLLHEFLKLGGVELARVKAAPVVRALRILKVIHAHSCCFNAKAETCAIGPAEAPVRPKR